MNLRLAILCLAPLGFTACGSSSSTPGGSSPEPEPEAPAYEIQVDWNAAGSGEAFALAVADFDGDGAAEVAVGGRRVSVVRDGGAESAWIAGWLPQAGESVLFHGENDWASALAVVPRGDAVPGLLICDSRGHAYLRDGATGEVVWHAELDVDFPFCLSVALFGSADAPLFFPRYGGSAWSSLTGERVWTTDLPRGPFFVAASRRAGEAPGLLAVTEPVSDDVRPASGFAATTKTFPGSVQIFHADGTLAWRTELDDADRPCVATAADLDGSGTDAPVIGFVGGRIRAWGTDGEVRFEKPLAPFGQDPERTVFAAFFAKDVDGDGRDELFAVIRDGRHTESPMGPGLILALDADGEELWRQSFTRAVEHASLDVLGGEDVLLLGLGARDRSTSGQAVAIRLAADAATRIAVQVPTQHAIYSVAVVPDATGDRLAIGSQDGRLQVVDGSGATAWTHHLSSWLQAITAVPASGGDWVAVGDEFANLAAYDETGKLRWSGRMESQATAATLAIAAGGEAEPLVVAGAAVADARGAGLLEAWSLDGVRRRVAFLPGLPLAISVVGDAAVVVEGPGPREEECRLVARSLEDLVEIWSLPLVPCFRAEISTGDEAKDGSTALAVRVEPPSGENSFIVLAELDGTVLDFHQESLERSLWVKAVPGGVVAGGSAIGAQGFVSFRPHGDSRPAWRTLLDSTPDASFPIGGPIPGNAVSGAIVGDLNGDGVDEIAVSTAANDVILLDGATGEIRWRLNLEPSSVPYPEKHVGGPIAFLPGAGDVPPVLVATQGLQLRARTRIFVVTLDGALVGAVDSDAEAFAIVVADRADGPPAAVVAAGHGATALRTRLLETQ